MCSPRWGPLLSVWPAAATTVRPPIRRAIAPANWTTREPDEPGVRLRFYLDLHQDADT
ncbi:DUF6207 family protein [Streptomyces sp. NPDC006739]|uniref:DUF6207 family protein n=1 Tax=Streptomyces sp. NPDC006739 TaxID=3364763 RepID=UPI00369B9F01